MVMSLSVEIKITNYKENSRAKALQTRYCLPLFVSHASKLSRVKTNFTRHPANSKSVMFDNDYASPC